MDGESRFSAIFGQLRTLSDPLIILLISRSLVRIQQGSPYFPGEANQRFLNADRQVDPRWFESSRAHHFLVLSTFRPSTFHASKK
jgi:hypothetical protein